MTYANTRAQLPIIPPSTSLTVLSTRSRRFRAFIQRGIPEAVEPLDGDGRASYNGNKAANKVQDRFAARYKSQRVFARLCSLAPRRFNPFCLIMKNRRPAPQRGAPVPAAGFVYRVFHVQAFTGLRSVAKGVSRLRQKVTLPRSPGFHLEFAP